MGYGSVCWPVMFKTEIKSERNEKRGRSEEEGKDVTLTTYSNHHHIITNDHSKILQ